MSEVGGGALVVELGGRAGDVGERLVEATRLVLVVEVGVEVGEAVVELVGDESMRAEKGRKSPPPSP
jgi:hypothetical protein